MTRPACPEAKGTYAFCVLKCVPLLPPVNERGAETHEKKNWNAGTLPLFAILLVSMGVVPAMAAQSDDETLANRLNIQSPYFKSTDKVTDSKVIPIDAEKYNKPMSKEEFYRANEEYIKFLTKQFGEEIATKMVEDAYIKATVHPSEVGIKSLGDIRQILGEDVYIWPYVSRDTVMDDSDGPANLIFFNRNRHQAAMDFINTGQWNTALGYAEYSMRGDSPSSLAWVGSSGTGGSTNQIENGAYLTTRYHMVLFDGLYDPDIGYWCYGNCHYETFQLPIGHVLSDNCCIYGRNFAFGFADDYLNLDDWTWVNLFNSDGWEWAHDGWGIVLHMG